MTLQELKEAIKLAESNQPLPDIGVKFDGFGLPGFKQTLCTLKEIAALLQWQGMQLNGQWDMDAVNEVYRCGKHRFLIVG